MYPYLAFVPSMNQKWTERNYKNSSSYLSKVRPSPRNLQQVLDTTMLWDYGCLLLQRRPRYTYSNNVYKAIQLSHTYVKFSRKHPVPVVSEGVRKKSALVGIEMCCDNY